MLKVTYGRRALAGAWVLLSGLATCSACSPSTGDTKNGNGSAGGSGAGASAGTGGGSGTGASSGSGGGPVIGPVMKAPDPNTGADGSCAATTSSAEQVTTTEQVPVTETVTTTSPIALYLMQDQSGSMLEPFLPPTKWNMATGAITSFVSDPASAGIDVALQYFALATGACDGSSYNVPEVPMALLPGNATPIVNSLNAHIPSTGTPIEPALRGVTQYCAAYQPQQPGEKCIAVLITDGAPSACDLNTQNLAKIAADAYARNGVITFTIGMQGADFAVLDAIAAAGHGDCTPATPLGSGGEACNVSGGGSSFIDALNTIRTTVTTQVTHTVTHTVTKTTKLACEFSVPTPPPGETFKPDQVNVQFTTANGTEDVYKVGTQAECATTKVKAWYYDVDPMQATPTKILMCPNTCSVLQAATGDGGVLLSTAPRVDVLLKCPTKVAPPS